MKGDTDLPALEVEKTLPRKTVEGKRCNSRSFQSIGSKQRGSSEEILKEPYSDHECGHCYTSKV
jgi:hypothetical protein